MLFILGVCSKLESIDQLFNILKKQKFPVQAFSPCVTEKIVKFGYFQAFKAFHSGHAFANSFSNEILLRTAATSKVDEAIKKIGVKNPGEFVLVADCTKEQQEKLLKELEGKINKKIIGKAAAQLGAAYGIKSVKFAAEDLVIEKIALQS